MTNKLDTQSIMKFQEDYRQVIKDLIKSSNLPPDLTLMLLTILPRSDEILFLEFLGQLNNPTTGRLALEIYIDSLESCLVTSRLFLNAIKQRTEDEIT
jgi:hypothetical protein